MRGFKDGSPIDSVVRIAYDASVNVAVRLDMQDASAAGKGAQSLGGGKFGSVAMGVVAPPYVYLSDNSFIAIVEESDPRGIFRAVNVEIVASMPMESNKHTQLAGFFSARAHFFGTLLVGFVAFANTTFKTAGDDQEIKASLCGEISALLEFVAFDLV